MAVTENLYTGNGSTVLYSFTFPYLETTDIKVSVNGTITTAYTLANATTIQFNTAPVNGAAIRIYRQTDDAALAATFYSGSAIRAGDLNENFTQNLYVTQESTNNAATATTTANTALTNSNTAISTANSAVSTANTASSNASAAVATANTASSNASAAVSTANTASSNATTAVNTANAATATANSAASDAATALSTANAATSTANAASAAATNAVNTANAASSAASSAVSTANTASSNASAAVSTANTASSNATSAVNTANSALSTANAAASAVANAILYDIVANVAAIPGSPANNDAVEVTDSTGIESFTPLTGVPGGFTGNSGLSVRIVYTTTGNTWTWIQYFPNDPEARYFKQSGGTLTGALGVTAGSAASPSVFISGDTNTGIYSPGADQVALSTNGTGRLFVDASGNVLINDSASVTSNVSAYLRIRQSNAAADTSIGIINAQNSDANATVKIKAGQVTRNGGEIVFGRENGQDWSTTTSADGYIAFSPVLNNTNTERLRITSAGLVGIGTTSPSYPLSIFNNGGNLIQLSKTGDAVAGSLIGRANVTDELRIQNSENAPIAFLTNNTERARIDSSGRLLVGTANSRAVGGAAAGDFQIEVSGSKRCATFVRNGGTSILTLGSTGATGIGNTTILANNADLGSIEFAGADGTDLQTLGASISAAVDGTPGVDDMPGRLVFATTADGASSPTERLRITSDGQILIGKTSSSLLGDADLEVQKFAYSTSGFGNYPYNNYGPVESITIVNGGSGYTDGSYAFIPLRTNGGQLGVFADIVVSGGTVTSVTPVTDGRSESNSVGSVLTLNDPAVLGAGGTGLDLQVGSIRNAYFGVYANPARIRLGNFDTTTAADQELGAILFSNRDSGGAFPYGYAGDTARIYARAVGTSGGGYLDFWAANNSEMAASSMVVKRTGVGIGTTSPTSHNSIDRVLNIDGANGTKSGISLSEAGANYFDIYFDGSNNAAHIDQSASGGLIFTSGSSEAFRVDSSGRLLVGTSSTSGNNASLQVRNDNSGAVHIQAFRSSDSALAAPNISVARSRGTAASPTEVTTNDLLGTFSFIGYDGASWAAGATIEAYADGTWTDGGDTTDNPGRLVFSTTADGASSPTERMRIQSDGRIVAGGAVPASSATGSVFLTAGSSSTTGSVGWESYVTTTATRYHASFSISGSVVGSISTSGSSTAYNTSSDYRLKENVTPVTDGITRLQQLKPSRFNFIADPSTVVDGFIAHEVQAVVPEAITGEKDAVDDDGKPQYQGIDQSKLVPLLTAALQEAVAKIESLEARLTAAGL